jgi:hypothetical protein
MLKHVDIDVSVFDRHTKFVLLVLYCTLYALQYQCEARLK